MCRRQASQLYALVLALTETRDNSIYTAIFQRVVIFFAFLGCMFALRISPLFFISLVYKTLSLMHSEHAFSSAHDIKYNGLIPISLVFRMLRQGPSRPSVLLTISARASSPTRAK